MRATIRVPATVANLGPGFDILAMALQLQNELVAEVSGDRLVTIEIDGAGDDGEKNLLDPARNLVARAYARACSQLGVAAGDAGVRLRCVNAIPMGRGLGSSAAAAVSGVLAAVALHRAPWAEAEIIDCAGSFEGHLDNAAAALLGGLAVCAPGAVPRRFDVPDEITAVVYVPDQRLATQQARAAVATSFSREDAIFNAGRSALLVRSLLLRDYAALREAMDDRWHQTQRAALFPAMSSLIRAAYDGGADGACLAGAGPSVLALTARDPGPVVEALTSKAAQLGVSGAAMRLRPRNFGARVDVSQ